MSFFRMLDNPAYCDIQKHIEELNSTWNHLQVMMGTAPISKNPFSSTNKCIRAQKYQCKMIDKKVNGLCDLLYQLQQAWEETATIW